MLTDWLFDGRQLILRIVCAAVASFAIVVLLSPRTIRFLVRKKLGDRPEFDHAALNELTRHKSATPTMGGILIVLAIFISLLLFGDLKSMYIRMAFLTLVWLGALGAVDDWLKLQRSARAAAGLDVGTREGLRMYQKILFQVGLAVLLGIFIYNHGSEGYKRPAPGGDSAGPAVAAPGPKGGAGVAGADPAPETRPAAAGRARYAYAQDFCVPFKNEPIHLSLLAYVIITVLVMVGTSNAVNLTDGMDGLASGCMVIVAGLFLVLSWVAGNEQWALLLKVPHVFTAAELAVLCAAVVGSCLGFLWYNCLPAQVFMGDTGSLALGGLLGYIAVVIRQELALFIAGGVFVFEALSVLLQVSYFKASGGKRVFLCAPVHHHFHLKGWAESKVVARFWIVTILLTAIALATLKMR